jgi:hypothetical protein
MPADMNRRICAAALAALALAGWPAHPQQSAPTRYTVEILVFRGGGGGGSEDLSASTSGIGATTGSIASAPDTQRRLGDAAARLRATAGYRVIAHTAWVQSPAAWNSRRGISAEQLGLANAGITGTVVLERGQYLHLGFDLHISDGNRSYTLAELRRVRPNERQYFDHPAVGIIALVTTTG